MRHTLIPGSSPNIVQQSQRHEGDFLPALPSCKKQEHLKLQLAQVGVPEPCHADPALPQGRSSSDGGGEEGGWPQAVSNGT